MNYSRDIKLLQAILLALQEYEGEGNKLPEKIDLFEELVCQYTKSTIPDLSYDEVNTFLQDSLEHIFGIT